LAVGWFYDNRAVLPGKLDAFFEFEDQPALDGDERPFGRQWMRQLQLVA
jgi:hypothetical protein